MTAIPPPIEGLVSCIEQAKADNISVQGVHQRLNRLAVPTLLWAGQRWFFKNDYEAAILARLRQPRRRAA